MLSSLKPAILIPVSNGGKAKEKEYKPCQKSREYACGYEHTKGAAIPKAALFVSI